ncbi:ribonuclease III [Flaviflexus ciconiae]|uniref:Ribonuclease 3 n=1 Tax=Flaviflexus ciconiae TaxID=2496867 RepID=A0A3S9PWP6_9ACTO|nr:ribonuclease III [Flaviflexus ciconiae]AZQ76810.1 ribonuclease III [Flaviflexus ciconiae]
MSRSKGRRKVNPPARTDREVLLASWGVDIEEALLEQALTHRSWSFENGNVPTNERLELLGDSVLSIIVTDRIYHDYPDMSEAELVPIRAAAVSETPLADIAKTIGLDGFILLGNGELVTDGRNKPSILSDTLEALIGATYLTVGLDKTRGVVEKLTAPYIIDATKAGPALDWKTSIQMVANEGKLGDVSYKIEGSGPDHARHYVATTMIGGKAWGEGEGTSRAKAEMAAAEASYEALTKAVHA